MNITMGAKIRALRKNRNISQEVLAQYLGISFQAVSKWEKGDCLPDVAMIPAIASFFEVSIDELFDFNRMETERKVQQACWDIAPYRYTEPERAEQDLRKLLKQYPGHEIILNNLIYSLQINKKYEEVIDTCKALIESASEADIKYDAARILAETYKELGEYTLCKEAIDLIPEFYFSHLEELALLLEGEDMFRPAWDQKCQSLATAVSMNLRLADYYEARGERDNAQHQLMQAKAMIEAVKDDIVPPFWNSTLYAYLRKEYWESIEQKLKNMA